MSEDKGLSAIPVRLTPDQARIIDAHAQLVKSLKSIKIPKSGRWEERETAISVLEILSNYLTATLDKEHTSEDVVMVYQSDQRAILQDIIWHLEEAKHGRENPRLAVNRSLSGAAHDAASVKLQTDAVALVNAVSEKMKEEGIKNHKVEARREVANEYKRLGITSQTNSSRDPEEIDARMLENWEKGTRRKNPTRSV